MSKSKDTSSDSFYLRSPRFMRSLRNKKKKQKRSDSIPSTQLYDHLDVNLDNSDNSTDLKEQFKPKIPPPVPPRRTTFSSQSTKSENIQPYRSPSIPEVSRIQKRLTISPEVFNELDFLLSKSPTPTQNKKELNKSYRKSYYPHRQRSKSADNDVYAEIKEKLEKEKLLLTQDRNKVKNFSGSSNELKMLKYSISERVTLISSLRQNLYLQNEFLMDNGYIYMKKDINSEFVKFWIILEYPQIQFFINECYPEPIDIISLSSVSRIHKKLDSLSFTIRTTTNCIDFKTDTIEECQVWLRSFSVATGVSITTKEKAMKLQSQKDFRKVMKKNPDGIITADGEQKKQKEFYKETYCDHFQDIRYLFSEYITTKETKNGYKLIGGTFDDIVIWCIINSIFESKNKDTAAFLLCSGWICSSKELYEKICDIWDEWNENGFPTDIPELAMIHRIKNFLKQLIEFPVLSSYENEAFLRGNLRDYISNNNDTLKDYLREATFPQKMQHEKTESTISSSDIVTENAASFPIETLANELTLQEAELYRKISISEFMDCNWENESKGPNICYLVSRYNKISNWVAFSILDQIDARAYVKMFKKFLQLASQLHKLQNYNTCTAILGGLSDASIARLKCIKNNLSEKYTLKFEELKEIYSPIDGYKVYRQLPIHPSCIPALAVYLRDLTLTLDGNPIYLDKENEVINFERMRLVAERVLELYHIDTKLFTTDLVGDFSLKRHLAHINPPNADELYDLSIKIEPTRSKRTLEEEVESLREENILLKQDIVQLKTNEKNRLVAQQQLLEEIQNSNSKASTTVRALLESISEGTSNPNEQMILLKLQLQAALDLCITLDKQQNN